MNANIQRFVFEEFLHYRLRRTLPGLVARCDRVNEGENSTLALGRTLRLTFDTVQLERTFCFRCCKSALAGLLIALVLLSSFLAVSPALHEVLHQNASQDSHHCVVTLLQKQQLLSGEPQPILLAVVSTLIGEVAPLRTPFILAVDYSFAPSRAPPVDSSSFALVG